MWWWLAGCPHRAPDPIARAQQLLAEADAAWERRGALGYDVASRPLLEAYGLAPHLPGVAWRLARWRLAEGLATDDPVAAKASFAEARASAVGCLEADPAFVARRAQSGWGDALDALGPVRAPCVAWAALSWARWLEVHGGAAASLDLEALDSLVAAGTASADPDVRALASWAGGITDAVRPDWAGRDLADAREQLRVAVQADPRSIVALVDLYDLVVSEVGTQAEQADLSRRIRSLPVTNPEDQQARTRLGPE